MNENMQTYNGFDFSNPWIAIPTIAVIGIVLCVAIKYNSDVEYDNGIVSFGIHPSQNSTSLTPT